MAKGNPSGTKTRMVHRTCVRFAAFAAVLALAGCPEPADLSPQPGGTGEHLLRFVQITDVHITDEESPARAVRADGLIPTAWRPQEAYGTQTLDATLRVLNACHAGGAFPVDFVIVTGDLTDNAQFNELRWFLDVMDGQAVLPDSGEAEGPFRDVAPEDNPNLEFEAAGLAPDIPWYTAFGNHDGLAIGTFAICREADDATAWLSPQFRLVAAAIGLHRLEPPLNAFLPTYDQSPAAILADAEHIDPVTLQLVIRELPAGPVPPDPARHYLSRASFIAEHFDTATTPAGHGFDEDNLASGDAWYSCRPKADVPVRLIVLDTAAPNPPCGFSVEYGVMTRRQFEGFLKPEVEAAQAAGEFVVIASHHPSAEFRKPYPGRTVTTLEFRTYLACQPNVIAHICGHEHRHRVTQIPGRYPYIEIETASLIEYPQEIRVLDVFYDESDGSIRLESAMLCHTADPTVLSAESFRRATVDLEYQKSAKDAGVTLAHLIPPVAERSGEARELPEFDGLEPLPSKEERYGGPSDRAFSFVFKRGLSPRN
ncbi:MAG: metallophosphoesterase [Candidatus Hydrogenedentes bacterium]|nr:metallophosphoesterase [Candidatus Hydrogenedentota bacterium]